MNLDDIATIGPRCAEVVEQLMRLTSLAGAMSTVAQANQNEITRDALKEGQENMKVALLSAVHELIEIATIVMPETAKSAEQMIRIFSPELRRN